MASRFAGVTIADFGPFEAQVRELLAVEANLGGRRGELGEKTLEGLLQRLAMWRADHADAAFANGVRIGIESGKGVAYAGGAIRRYDPERDAVRPRAVPEPNDSDRLPTLLQLIAEGKAEAVTTLPPWKRPPFHPDYIAWREANPEALIPA
jgi:hypothetical protein